MKQLLDNITISTALNAPEWDAFVANTVGGHHVQTSLWAQVKAELDWRPLRIVVERENSIIAGCQVLVHSIPLLGTIGYVTKGPLCRMEDPRIIMQIVEQLVLLCRRHGIKVIAIQPPDNGEYISHILSENDFAPSTLELAPRASIVIDVSVDESRLFQQLQKRTRNDITHSRRAGVVVRTGAEEDLPTFYNLYSSTSKRQKFLPFHESYFNAMFRILGPHGHIQLLFAEIQGEPVSTALLVPFGDTTIFKILGWSGQHKEAKPNAALIWEILLWARAHDYHYVDLEGVDLEGAKRLLNGEPLGPKSLRLSYDLLKYGFGGKVVIFPEPHDMVFNPAYSWLFHRLQLGVTQRNALSRTIDFLRKR